ncbi:G-protein coupled receptor 157-like [Montipora foliosa]|uniref:G-protein coupled receptor 157-like n=1 Tax=Montipora foliosa TaxID=591990 RepID=UPI0035F1E87F
MSTSTAEWSNLTAATTPSFLQRKANTPTNRVLTTLSGSLSLLGTSLIIVTYFLWKDFRSTSRTILVYISFADFCIAGGTLVALWHGSAGVNKLCIVQSFVTTTASLWSFFWTTFLAAFMYMTVVKKQRKKAQIMFKVFHVLGWGIPLVIVGTALGLNKLGNDNDYFTSGWCWIQFNLSDKRFWMLITGKGWEMASYILCSAFYFMLKLHIRNEVRHHRRQFPSETSKETALKIERKLTLVPVIFVMVRIWGTVRFILYVSDPHSASEQHAWWEEALLYLQGMGDSSQGFANFLLFCFFTERFQAHLSQATHNLFSRCRKQESVSETSQSTEATHSQKTVVNEK